MGNLLSPMPHPSTVQQPAELLAYLFTAWPDVKKKQIRTWLKFKSVTVNGQVLTQFNHPLKPGDVVAIRTDRFATPNTKLSTGIRICYEDDAVIVIEKPDRLLTIASEKVQDNTVYHHLTDYLRQGDQFSRARVWIVHRLDRDTSGLMVFAKTEQAKRELQLNWDKADKRYYAIVEGHLPDETGTFRSYLNEENPGKVYVTEAGGQARLAITHYRVLKTHERYSLVRLSLETGRRHQIRVQLADAGCPIVGDDKYGSKHDPIKRMALHACSLEFPHPVTGARVKFESQLPGNFGPLVGGYSPRKGAAAIKKSREAAKEASKLARPPKIVKPAKPPTPPSRPAKRRD